MALRKYRLVELINKCTALQTEYDYDIVDIYGGETTCDLLWSDSGFQTGLELAFNLTEIVINFTSDFSITDVGFEARVGIGSKESNATTKIMSWVKIENY